MTSLAYVDIRPLLFIGGLPLFTGLSLLFLWISGVRLKKGAVALVSAIVFTLIFLFFLTGIGPFIGREETREYWMTWEVKPKQPEDTKETEIVLSFVDYPESFIGEYSDELAAYLCEKGDERVRVVFEVTSDYGKVRGFHWTQIGALKKWHGEMGYAGGGDDSCVSPWD